MTSIKQKIKYDCSILGGRSANEDFHSTGNIYTPKLGDISYYQVFDGHNGHLLSKYLNDNFSKIFEKKLNIFVKKKYLSSELVIIKAIEATNVELINLVVGNNNYCKSGSTIIVTYCVSKLKKAFTFCLGDSRFLCYDTITGNIKKTLVKTIDLEDNKIYEYKNGMKESTNFLHFFPSKPVLKIDCEELSTFSKYEKGDISKNYIFHEENNEELLREWELLLLNKKSNPTGYFQNLKQHPDNSVRYKLLQPTRSLESNLYDYKCLTKGVIHIVNITENTGFFIGCDGFEDGNTLNKYDICNFLVTPAFIANKVYNSNFIRYIRDTSWYLPRNKNVLGTMKIKEINFNMSFVDLIKWLHINFCQNETTSFPIKSCVQDGYKKAIDYFYKNINKNNQLLFYNFNKIEALANLAILYGSSDNITGIYWI